MESRIYRIAVHLQQMNCSLFFRGRSKAKCKEGTHCTEKVGLSWCSCSLCSFYNTFSLQTVFFSVEVPPRTVVSSKEMAANCVRRALRHRVMVSSVRQAVCGLLASGGGVAAQYLGKKMAKAWRSRVP